MSDSDKDEAARALERLTSGQSSAPTPQPRPRAAPTPQVRANPAIAKPAPKQAAPKQAQKVARPAAPSSPPRQSLAEATTARRPQVSKRGKPGASPGMALRRTLIPVLLTGGFLLFVLALVRFAWNAVDNPMLDLPRGIVIAMISLGVICWLLAAANMFVVRRALQKSQKDQPAGPR